MRIDLWFVGVKGYWLLERIDFSRVCDLDEEGKKCVFKKWRVGMVGVFGNLMSELIVIMV